MNFKIAVLQSRSQSYDISNSVENIIRQMKNSTEQNADILLLPECYLTGYELPIANEAALNDDSMVKAYGELIKDIIKAPFIK
jgi:predicted amidohydrolase